MSFSNAAGQQRALISTFRDFLLLLLVLVGQRRFLQRAADALLVGPVACKEFVAVTGDQLQHTDSHSETRQTCRIRVAAGLKSGIDTSKSLLSPSWQ